MLNEKNALREYFKKKIKYRFAAQGDSITSPNLAEERFNQVPSKNDDIVILFVNTKYIFTGSLCIETKNGVPDDMCKQVFSKCVSLNAFNIFLSISEDVATNYQKDIDSFKEKIKLLEVSVLDTITKNNIENPKRVSARSSHFQKTL